MESGDRQPPGLLLRDQDVADFFRVSNLKCCGARGLYSTFGDCIPELVNIAPPVQHQGPKYMPLDSYFSSGDSGAANLNVRNPLTTDGSAIHTMRPNKM